MIRSCSTCEYRDHLGDEYPCIDCDEWGNHYEPKEKTNEYRLKKASRNEVVTMLFDLVTNMPDYDNNDECLNFLNNWLDDIK